ncbi:MAG: hypothetical protein HUJ54_02230 [Erysipelotrichaceae bacterium]|nr:hypothetical protein [Erysipelotrichaceae bacterium]
MFKKAIPGILALGLLIAGCSSEPVPVSKDDAPTDIMKKAAALSSESTGQQVQEVLDELIKKTAEADGWKVTFDTSSELSSLTVQSSQLQSMTGKSRSVDTRMIQDDTVYEILEQQSNDQLQAGFMKANPSETVTVYGLYQTGQINAANSSVTIQEISKTDSSVSADKIKEVTEGTILYPFYPLVGSNLVLKPFVNPEQYTFALTRSGSDYILNIAVKDLDAYNKALDEYVETSMKTKRTDILGDGSFMADSYKTTAVNTNIVMNKDGIISSIHSYTNSDVSSQGSVFNAYTDSTCKISAAPKKMSEFLPKLFQDVADGNLKQGDSVKLP